MANKLRSGSLILFVWCLVVIPLLIPNVAVQTDELEHWYHRSYRFLQAVPQQNWAATVQTEHPGVTTMAMGALGHLILQQIDPTRAMPLHEQLYWLRLPVVLVNSVIITLGYVLMRYLFGGKTAILGAVLWATAPYLRWYDRLLHIDGMSTNFMMLSLLLLIAAFDLHRRREESTGIHWRWLVLSAFVGGLAALTRFTGFFVAAMTGIAALLSLSGREWRQWQVMLRRVVLPVLVFTLVILLTWTALYPAMWTNRSAIIEETLNGIDNATRPHENGNYFLGQSVDDPGAVFYVYATLLRISPLTMIGVALAIQVMLLETSPVRKQVLIVGVLYVILYLIFLSYLPKKFDRYALPVFPMLHLMAAFGWGWVLERVSQRLKWDDKRLLLVALITVMGYSAWFYPADYAHANPMLGGGRTAEWALLIGGGEGLQQAAQFIDDQYEGAVPCDVQVLSSYADILKSYLPCVDVDRLDASDIEWTEVAGAPFVVRYVNARQRHPVTSLIFDEVQPIYRGVSNGISFVDVYRGVDVWHAYRGVFETMYGNYQFEPVP